MGQYVYVKMSDLDARDFSGDTTVSYDIPNDLFVTDIVLTVAGYGNASQTEATLEGLYDRMEIRAQGKTIWGGPGFSGIDAAAWFAVQANSEPMVEASATTTTRIAAAHHICFGQHPFDLSHSLPAVNFDPVAKVHLEYNTTNRDLYQGTPTLDGVVIGYRPDAGEIVQTNGILNPYHLGEITAGTTRGNERLNQGLKHFGVLLYYSTLAGNMTSDVSVSGSKDGEDIYGSTVMQQVLATMYENMGKDAFDHIASYTGASYAWLNFGALVDPANMADFRVYCERAASASVQVMPVVLKPIGELGAQKIDPPPSVVPVAGSGLNLEFVGGASAPTTSGKTGNVSRLQR